MTQPTNDSRADAAIFGLGAWYEAKEARPISYLDEEVSECIDDFLADLMHWLHREGVSHDWEASLATARLHFEAEL